MRPSSWEVRVCFGKPSHFVLICKCLITIDEVCDTGTTSCESSLADGCLERTGHPHSTYFTTTKIFPPKPASRWKGDPLLSLKNLNKTCPSMTKVKYRVVSVKFRGTIALCAGPILRCCPWPCSGHIAALVYHQSSFFQFLVSTKISPLSLLSSLCQSCEASFKRWTLIFLRYQISHLSHRYHRSTARKGKAKDMFPPGRILFLRPIKVLDRQESKKEQGVKQQWDAIWITPQELIQEGILVSKKVRKLLCKFWEGLAAQALNANKVALLEFLHPKAHYDYHS